MNRQECIAAGVDPAQVAKLEKMLNKAGRMAQDMGVIVFGGSGNGTLRKCERGGSIDTRRLILAHLDATGVWDGGDGACLEDEMGLLRGE